MLAAQEIMKADMKMGQEEMKLLEIKALQEMKTDIKETAKAE